MEKFLEKTKYLIELDLSATSLKSFGPQLSNLRRLYLDFCSFSNDAFLSTEHFPRLKYLSIFGTTDLTFVSTPSKNELIKVVKSSGHESENQLRDFAAKRGIKLTNWAVTRNSMVKGVPFMLSQIPLLSMVDRES